MGVLREVAIKVPPADAASDAARLKRFEKEARAASALNHPNLVTIYEVESVDSTTFIAVFRELSQLYLVDGLK